MTALAGRPTGLRGGDVRRVQATTVIGVLITIPDPVAAQLARWRDRFVHPALPGVPAHITLLPPTLVASNRLAVIERHLRRTVSGFGPFEVHLRGSGTFRPVSPVTFVQVAAGIGPCEQLESRIRTGPLFRPLPFPFHPHVTVAQNVEASVLERVDTDLARFDARFHARRVDLYQADSGEFPAWSVRAGFPLRDTVPLRDTTSLRDTIRGQLAN